MAQEMLVDHLYLRLDGRVFEVLSDQSDYAKRIHVDSLMVRVKGPERDGGYKVQIGMEKDGEWFPAGGAVRASLDATEFERFERLVAAAEAARAAGPEPW